MKEFFELLVDKYGFPEFVANDLMLLVYLLVGLAACWRVGRSMVGLTRKRAIKKLVMTDLHPYFTFNEVAKYTKYYIPQYYQNLAS